MNARRAFGYVVLLLAAIASWYLASSLERDVAPTGDPGALQQGYYLRGARILGTGEDGALIYEIEAEYAEQQGAGEIAFDNVRVRYADERDVPWWLSADHAVITGDQDRLTLSGHVRAVSNAGFGGRETEIRTEWLELEPQNYRASTDQRVQIRIGERSLTATGMEALLRENRLSLKSNVSGKFAP